MMSDKPDLLTDDQIISFVIHGYHILEVDFPDGINEMVYDEISQLENNPGDGILDAVPKLYQVYDHPQVRGALVSLLGKDYQ
ncbi:MAG: phytanoyl-CoA dioxygenase, partial [Candidatus Poribacteria bacterium]|nr:phytanoyl-CoA dioxygenase [Candidatus Poribacteria bacterium]